MNLMSAYIHILNLILFCIKGVLVTSSFTGCYSTLIPDFGGSLTDESPIWTIQSINSRHCAAYCIRDTVCVSFFYKQHVGCLGFSNVLSSVSVLAGTSGWRYYKTCKGKLLQHP